MEVTMATEVNHTKFEDLFYSKAKWLQTATMNKQSG